MLTDREWERVLWCVEAFDLAVVPEDRRAAEVAAKIKEQTGLRALTGSPDEAFDA